MTGRAVLIGRNSGSLEHCVRDVNLMHEALRAHGFECERIPTGLSLGEVIDAITQIADACRVHDTLIIYFSGHAYGEGGLQLVLADPMRKQANRLSGATLVEQLRRCRARSKLLILDSCHAGQAVDRADDWPSQPRDDFRILTATDGRLRTREDDQLQAGVFTYQLHRALTDKTLRRPGPDGVLDAAGHLSVDSIDPWLRRAMRGYKAAEGGQRQPEPRLYGSTAIGVFFANDLSPPRRERPETAAEVAGGHDRAPDDNGLLKTRDRDRPLEKLNGLLGRGATSRRAAAEAIDARGWTGWPLLALGLAPGLGLGLLALRSPIATGALVLFLAPAVWLAGRRLRLVWDDASLPITLRDPAPPTPPYPLSDPLIELMALPSGRFWMGSDQRLDPDSSPSERPRHRVRLDAFAIARTPVTCGLYREVMGEAPPEWSDKGQDGELPANYLDWEQALRFCNALSLRTGLEPCYRQRKGAWVCRWRASGYRLPTEAEWEYACRAGSETRWFWGDDASAADNFAWYGNNSGRKPHPVGTKTPNPWGLFDMSGNVWEWCWDRWRGHYWLAGRRNPHGPLLDGRRVLRGGSFNGVPRVLRSADRDWGEPGFRDVDVGFRCVRGSVRQLDH